MTDYADLIAYEEGYREDPYHCSEGYPTIGFGMRIGPKGTPLTNYTFKVTRPVAELWLSEHTDEVLKELDLWPSTRGAMAAALLADGKDENTWQWSPRACVIVSMAHQMGCAGLRQFVQTLKYMSQANWLAARQNMLNSQWARQTPKRAKRHADQLETGTWSAMY